MNPYEEKATRTQAVRLRMAAIYEHLQGEEILMTKDLVDYFGPRSRGDLQKLWEDGRVVRWKCPEVSMEFGIHPSSWFWATVETASWWDKEDAAA